MGWGGRRAPPWPCPSGGRRAWGGPKARGRGRGDGRGIPGFPPRTPTPARTGPHCLRTGGSAWYPRAGNSSGSPQALGGPQYPQRKVNRLRGGLAAPGGLVPPARPGGGGRAGRRALPRPCPCDPQPGLPRWALLTPLLGSSCPPGCRGPGRPWGFSWSSTRGVAMSGGLFSPTAPLPTRFPQVGSCGVKQPLQWRVIGACTSHSPEGT